MSASASSSSGAPAGGARDDSVLPASLADIDASCRAPLFFLFGSALAWLVIGSGLALLASLKFHSPGLLANCPWLTYGRVVPAQANVMIYGFAAQSGIAVTLFLLCRLGRTPLDLTGLITLGAAFWNLGVTIGVVGILAGESTGFEMLEMPRYASPILFCAYALIGAGALLAFHHRRIRPLFVSQWFLFAALFWFPWIYSTANLLLVFAPVRGTAQAAIDWWYINNLFTIWFGFIGLGAIFYFLPKLVGRPLHSYYLAAFAFWLLAVTGSWGGVPHGAPLPAWMPSLSTVGMVFALVPLIAIVINLHRTLAGRYARLKETPPGRFIAFGAMAYVLAGLLQAVQSLGAASKVTQFTLFITAQRQLCLYGFFAMILFGAIYHIVPHLTRLEWPSARLVNLHFACASSGIVLYVVPLLVGGILQGLALNKASVPFLEVMKSSLVFLRISTLGDVLMAAGNLALTLNFVQLLARQCRSCCLPALRSLAKPETAEATP